MAIEELHPDRLEEHWEVLAHHFSQAENWPKAVHYGRASAQKTGEFPEALNLLDKTRQWLLKLADDPQPQEMLIDILLQQERVCETLGERERQQQIIDELLALLEPAQDHAKLAMIYCRQGELYTLLNRFDAAEEVLNKSLRLSRDLADTVAERSALRSLGFLNWHQGRNEEAVANSEAALAIDRQSGDTQAIAGDLTNLGNILRHLGDYDRALKCLEEALTLYDVMPAPIKHGSTLYLVGSIHRELGDNDKALLYIQRALDISMQHRLVINQSFCLIAIANIYWEQGKIEDSLRVHKEAVDLNRKARYADGLAVSLRMLGEALLALERHAEALPYFREGAALFAQLARAFNPDNRYHHHDQQPKLREGAALFAQLADHQTRALMWSKVAGICEHEKNHPEAMAAWVKVRELRKLANNGLGELEALEGMARVSRLIERDPSLALQYYREALALAEKIQDRATEASLLNSMGIVEWNRGEYDQALQHYRITRTNHLIRIDATTGAGTLLGQMSSAGMSALAMRTDAVLTSVDEEHELPFPATYQLEQNYPNPFKPMTIIEISLPQSGFVTLKVYNLLGEEVATLLEAHKPAGRHTVDFDASKLASGLYYYTLTTGDFKQSRKMLLHVERRR